MFNIVPKGQQSNYVTVKTYIGLSSNYDGRASEIRYRDAKGSEVVLKASDNSKEFKRELDLVSPFLPLMYSAPKAIRDICERCEGNVDKANAELRERANAR